MVGGRAHGEQSLSEVRGQDLPGEVPGEEGRRKLGKAQEHVEEEVLSH